MRRVLAIAIVLAWSSQAVALDKEYAKDEDKTGQAAAAAQGWDREVKVGANFSLGQSRKVVGAVDGVTWTLGADFLGAVYYLRGSHDWRTSLTLIESFTYGPPINNFVKTADRLGFQTIYYYHIPTVTWLGPFAKFNLDTSLFESADFRATPVDYVISETDGTKTRVPGATRLHLTSSFLPLTLKEAVGLFARPIDRRPVALEFRAGFGSQQVFANDQRAVTDDAKTPAIEVSGLRDFVQAGLELGVLLEGSVWGDRMSYKAWADALTPFIRTNRAPSDDMGAWEATNLETGVKLGFRIVTWASLNYEFRALRVPQLVDAFQITNSLLVSFHYALPRKFSAPPPSAAAK